MRSATSYSLHILIKVKMPSGPSFIIVQNSRLTYQKHDNKSKSRGPLASIKECLLPEN